MGEAIVFTSGKGGVGKTTTIANTLAPKNLPVSLNCNLCD